MVAALLSTVGRRTEAHAQDLRLTDPRPEARLDGRLGVTDTDALLSPVDGTRGDR
jgi:hypothetical protein